MAPEMPPQNTAAGTWPPVPNEAELARKEAATPLVEREPRELAEELVRTKLTNRCLEEELNRYYAKYGPLDDDEH